MTPQDFKARTKRYALQVIEVVETLPGDMVSKTIGHQLLRSAMSVAANYRAAARAKSTADFISKMGTVEEECDESLFWLELLMDTKRLSTNSSATVIGEGREILAMTVASIRTARNAQRKI